jgi:hypothetical protein
VNATRADTPEPSASRTPHAGGKAPVNDAGADRPEPCAGPTPPTGAPSRQADGLSRRSFLASGAGLLAAGALPAWLPRRRRAPIRLADLGRPRALQAKALRVLGRSQLRQPDSLPDPSLPEGRPTPTAAS